MSAFGTKKKATIRKKGATLFALALAGMNLVLSGCAGLVNANNGNNQAPAILAEGAANITKNSAQIQWTTNVATTSQVQYGTTASYGSTTALDSTMVTSHVVALSALTANQTYHFRVVSSANGQQVTGDDLTFTTASSTAALAVSTGSLPAGTIGTAYSSSVQATGGQSPYTWTITSGTMAIGLTLSSSGTISGTPTTAGTASFTVQAKDAANATATKALTLTVAAAAQAPTVSTNSLAGGTVGSAYSTTLGATGGKTPYTWSVTSGALPAGLTLSSAGAISGTPTTAGSAAFTVQVKDSNNLTGAKSLNIVIAAASQSPSVSTTSLSAGTVGTAYSATLAATGGKTPYAWSISTGSLPAGLTLSSAGAISGTPTAAGTASFTVQVKDANNLTATKALSIAVTAAAQPPSVSTSTLAAGTVSTAYSATLAASGGKTPYTWSITTGALPAGLSISSAGAISGTPTAAATSSFTVQVKDANALTATKALSIVVNPAAATPLSISTTSLGTGVVGQTFNSTIKVSGGKASYTFAVSTGTLPAGLSLAASTGVVSGTPSTAGSSTFTVKVTDSSSPVQTASQSYTVTVSAGGGAMDQYLGLMSVPCTNNGTSFIVTKVNNNLVFCSPAGHALFARGFYVFDDNTSKSDESGGSSASYSTAKYGNTTSNWAPPQLNRIKNWGFNAVGPFSNAYARPVWSGQTVKVPFILFENSSNYSMTNNQGWGKGPVKDFLHLATATWQGYRPGCGIADYRDPNWAAYLAGTMVNDYVTTQTAAASAADKGYLLGVSFDDSDCLHGFGAGPDFATQPSGNNDFRLGYVALFIPPTDYANSSEKQIYTDGNVYIRKRLRDMLAAKYGTASSLNSAWGSGYSTLDSSGVCVGSQPISCASSAGADTVGSGNGSTLSFSTTLSHTTVSAYSLAIYAGGTLVGGDTGSGKIYGPSLSGTINYSTGALSLTFSGAAPAANAAITASYIANGWGIGTGFLDEDCRAAHASYCGSGKQTVTMSDVPSAVQADMNALTQDIAAYYSSTINNTIQSWASAHGFVGHVPHLGPSTLGTWTTPPDRYVLQGFKGNVDAWQYGGAGTFTQAELDFIQSNMGDVALIEGEYRTANADSPYSWPNSAAVHVGSAVTVTIVTPSQIIGTSTLIDVTCAASDYNQIQVRPTAVTAATVTYNAPGTPAEAATTCNLRVSDKNVGGFASQDARGKDFFSKVSVLPSRAYTATGTRPYIGYLWWQYQDNQSELLNWGVITLRDNAYDGTEDVNPAVSCVTIITSATCGKELRGPYGSVIPYLSQTNAAIDSFLISGK